MTPSNTTSDWQRKISQPLHLVASEKNVRKTMRDGIEFSPDFSPGDAMIAPDFLRQRAPATESIVILLVEGARARWRKKDKQGRIKRSLLWLDDEHIVITQ